MSSWVVSIVGIVLLGLVADVVLPQGQTNKYIKSIFSIVTIFVVVSPLPKLFDNFANTDEIVYSQESVFVDYSFVDSIKGLKAQEKESFLLDLFELNDIYDAKVQIYAKSDSDIFVVDFVSINIKNAVIQNKDKNINIKEKLKQIVVDYLGVSDDKVIFYE
ncbi:MAG: stage III sporulation protein AF [Clostridia bacterium]|nr:stage III sporulation protein AF [Clostridia bacterium]